jgi:hypothetical protein
MLGEGAGSAGILHNAAAKGSLMQEPPEASGPPSDEKSEGGGSPGGEADRVEPPAPPWQGAPPPTSPAAPFPSWPDGETVVQGGDRSKPRWRTPALVAGALVIFGLVGWVITAGGLGRSVLAGEADVVLAANIGASGPDEFKLGPSVDTALSSGRRIRLDTLQVIEVHRSDGAIGSADFVVVRDGRVAVLGTSRSSMALTLYPVDPDDRNSVELLSEPRGTLEVTYLQEFDRFFVTVRAEGRATCWRVDVDATPRRIGRGSCLLTTGGTLLVIEDRSDSTYVSVGDLEGVVGKEFGLELQPDSVSVTSDGAFIYGRPAEVGGRDLLEVFDLEGRQVWSAGTRALSTLLLDTGVAALLVATDRGDETLEVQLITPGDGSEASIEVVATAEAAAGFLAPDGSAIYLSTGIADEAFDEWERYAYSVSDGVGDPTPFYGGQLSGVTFLADGGVLAWDPDIRVLLAGSADGELTDIRDVDAEPQVLPIGDRTLVLADEELLLYTAANEDFTRLANDVRTVEVWDLENPPLVVYEDSFDDSFLVRLSDGGLEELDVAENLGFPVLLDGTLWYSIWRGEAFEFDQLKLSSLDLRGSESPQRVADDVVMMAPWFQNRAPVTRSPVSVVAVIDEVRRTCLAEGLDVVRSGDSRTFDEVPAPGIELCLTVDDEVDGNIDLLVESEADLVLTVRSGSGTSISEFDDVVDRTSGFILDLAPSAWDLPLDSGTYRLRLEPFTAADGASGKRAVLRVTSTATAPVGAMPVERSFSSHQDSGGNCTSTLEVANGAQVFVSQSWTTICIRQRRDVQQSLSLTNLGAIDGVWLDLSADCGSSGYNSTYTTGASLRFSIPAGKGWWACEVREDYPGDGSQGYMRVDFAPE